MSKKFHINICNGLIEKILLFSIILCNVSCISKNGSLKQHTPIQFTFTNTITKTLTLAFIPSVTNTASKIQPSETLPPSIITQEPSYTNTNPIIYIWKKLGPNFENHSNYIYSIAIDQNNSNTLYAVSGCCGLFKSNNRGENWFSISQYSEGVIAIDPSNSDVIYHAARQDSEDGRMYWGVVLKSNNGGGKWTKASIVAGWINIDSLVINPYDDNIIYVGAWGNINYPEANGVYKSLDAGLTWTRLGLYGTKALAIDPQNSSILYAGTLDGLYKSIDSGGTWKLLNIGCCNVRSIAIDPMTTTTIYVGSTKSIDGGETWKRMGGGGSVLKIDPKTPKIVYAGGESGVSKSMDGGTTWFNIGLEGIEILSIEINSQNTNIIYAATNSGVYMLNQE